MTRHSSLRYSQRVGRHSMAFLLLAALSSPAWSAQSEAVAPASLSSQVQGVLVAQASPVDAKAAADLLSRARTEATAQEWQKALATLNEAYELDRNNVDVVRLRREVLAEVAKAGGEAAPTADSLVKQAESFADGLEHEKALDAYNQALALDPKNKAARRGAEKMADAIKDKNEKLVKTMLDQSRAEIRSGNTAEAQRLLEQAQSIDPKNKRVAELLADVRRDQMAAAPPVVAETPKPAMPRAADMPASVDTTKPVMMAQPPAAPTAGIRTVAPPAAAPGAPAAPVVTSAVDFDAKMADAQAKIDAGDFDGAMAVYDSAKTEFPDRARRINTLASRAARERDRLAAAASAPVDAAVAPAADGMAATPAAAEEAAPAPASVSEQLEREGRSVRREAEKAFEAGLQNYKGEPKSIAGLEAARNSWMEALKIDPSFERARVYLENTEAEYNRLLQMQSSDASFEAAEAAADAKMRTLIPRITTTEPTPLASFLDDNIKPIVGVNFAIANGVDARVVASFTDKPLNEVLDSILLPIGLKWERTPGTDIVVIAPDVRTRVFRLTQQQFNTVEALYEKNTIQRLLYPPDGTTPSSMQRVYPDKALNAIVITDSVMNIDKLANLITDLEGQESTALEFRSFLIREDKAPEVKALLEAFLRAEDAAPYDPERKLIVEGGELIIKDTVENIRRVEQLLLDRNFMQKIYDSELVIGTFNLTPVLDIQENPDLARQFGANVRQVVETLLYSQEGVEASSAIGRRLWYDEATLQLTVTDTPDRVNQVARFINSLPQIQRERQTRIRSLNWADSSDLVTQINAFLGIEEDPLAALGGGGQEIRRTLSVDRELDFQGAIFIVTRVNENDVDDENDDDVELIVRSNTESDEVTIEENQLEEVLSGEFTIIADDVRPGSTDGEGRATLIIRHNPLGADGGGTDQAALQAAIAAAAATSPEDQPPIRLESIDNLNSVFIDYESEADLARVEEWIDRLDVPTLQVSMEIKFVEVVENKARQLKADFSIGDLTEGINLDDSVVRQRFAQDSDEFDSIYEPLMENIGSANLLKGATVTNWIINNGESPISFTLKALEAQGVINVVNAPSLTVLNNETGTFSISRFYRVPGVSTTTDTGGGGGTDGGTGGGTDGGTGGGTDGGTDGGTGGGTDGGTGTNTVTNNQTLIRSGQELRLVDNLEVTPSVTSAGNITLNPITVVIQDFDNNLGAINSLLSVGGNTTTVSSPEVARAIRNTGGYGVLEKDIETTARIRDGGTIVLGGWKNERTERSDSGVPILKDIPYVGKLLFNRMQETQDRTTLLIFLTGSVVRD